MTVTAVEITSSRSESMDRRFIAGASRVWRVHGAGVNAANIRTQLKAGVQIYGLPVYGSTYPDDSSLTLDAYTFGRESSNAILATAQYSNNRAFTFPQPVDKTNLVSTFLSWSGSMVDETFKIPFARRVKVEANSGGTTAEVESWAFEEQEIIGSTRTHQRPYIIDGSGSQNYDTLAGALRDIDQMHNTLHFIDDRWFRFECGPYREIEPFRVEIVYTWTYDPGHKYNPDLFNDPDLLFPFPSEVAPRPPLDLVYGSIDWLRPPFHNVYVKKSDGVNPVEFGTVLPYAVIDLGEGPGLSWQRLPGL